MPYVRPVAAAPVNLTLSRDLVRALKRGHPWVFADALRRRPQAAPGSVAVLHDGRGREIARGLYDPGTPLTFRACTTEPGEVPDDAWAERRFRRALALRRAVLGPETTGYRLFNGEGDGLPGLVCDVYGDTAVFRLDGEGPEAFWDAAGIARWIAEELPVRRAYQRWRIRGGPEGGPVLGEAPAGPVPFTEHGMRFTADVVRGQKTGFFLDMRENRRRVGGLAAGRSVLNLFGYTGGFSVAAGLGGARAVTTVDVAAPAVDAAREHWALNSLPASAHEALAADAFDFLERAQADRRTWELVVCDPPSFASSKSAVPKALAAYRKLAAAAGAVVAPGGLLCAGSCSSHVDAIMFQQAVEGGLGRLRRGATLLEAHGQPADHPTPLAFPEFRYLKFLVLRVD